MIQPTGYIRIITKELFEYGCSIFVKFVSFAEYILVCLPFLYLFKALFRHPEERIEPEQRAEDRKGYALIGMSMSHMACFMCDDLLALISFVIISQENCPDE